MREAVVTGVRRPIGVYIIAAYFGLQAAFLLIKALLLVAGVTTSLTAVQEPAGEVWGGVVLGLLLLRRLVLLFSSIIAVSGLLAFKHWGRWAAVLAAVLQLTGFPVFTVIGGLIIYYLLRRDVASAFS